MDKVIAVAWREFLTTVRTRAFILTLVMMPLLMVLGVFGTGFVQRMTEAEKVPLRRLAVSDEGGALFAELVAQFDAWNAGHPHQLFELERVDAAEATTETLVARVQADELYGYVVVPAGVLDVAAEARVDLARRDGQLEVGQRLERMINEAIYTARCRAAGIDVAEVARLRQPVEFNRIDGKTGQPLGDNLMARALTPFVFMLLMFLGTFGISQGLLTTLIEEKGSRIVEVLLSAVSPTQLMAGKILGTVLVGFLLIVFWGAIGMFGAARYALHDVVTGYHVLIAILYFVPGFLLIASLLAGIGAACNELKEAQSMVFPLSLITVIPMLFWFFIAQYPQSAFSIALSYVPPITPFIMILRICTDPDTPLWQIVTTLLLLWASVLAAIWAAGRVFRVGVLMYGKAPALRDLIRWVRQA